MPDPSEGISDEPITGAEHAAELLIRLRAADATIASLERTKLNLSETLWKKSEELDAAEATIAELTRERDETRAIAAALDPEHKFDHLDPDA